MRFTKMHGAGNDYVYVDCFAEPMPDDPQQLARQISDRHFGVGGDGLVLICPSEVADARMRMFNADGSEAEMCGNAIRCVGKYIHDHGLAVKESLTIETAIGVLPIELDIVDGTASRARVNLGKPTLAAADIPTTFSGDQVVDVPLAVGGHDLSVTCVSMGNPHCVTFVDKLSDDWVLGVGPLIENDPHFPQRVNAEFIEVISPSEVRMRVWERGSGETLACGTGAAAVCVAGVLTGRTQRRITVHLTGGDLELEWAEDGHVYKTGPAVEVFSGEWNPTHALSG
jgi:diaminopimelate epimerase